MTALIDGGLRLFKRAGIDRKTALELMAPLVRETIANILNNDTPVALTGPIARVVRVLSKNSCMY